MKFTKISDETGDYGKRRIEWESDCADFRFVLSYDRRRKPEMVWMWVSTQHTDNGDVKAQGFAKRHIDANMAARNWCFLQA